MKQFCWIMNFQRACVHSHFLWGSWLLTFLHHGCLLNRHTYKYIERLFKYIYLRELCCHNNVEMRNVGGCLKQGLKFSSTFITVLCVEMCGSLCVCGCVWCVGGCECGCGGWVWSFPVFPLYCLSFDMLRLNTSLLSSKFSFWQCLLIICDRLVVFPGYSDFLFLSYEADRYDIIKHRWM
jgi:hypothetical protein